MKVRDLFKDNNIVEMLEENFNIKRFYSYDEFLNYMQENYIVPVYKKAKSSDIEYQGYDYSMLIVLPRKHYVGLKFRIV